MESFASKTLSRDSLNSAICKGSLEDVRTLIFRFSLSKREQFDCVQLAVKNNQTEVTKLLLENDFEIINEQNNTPLWSAIRQCNLEIIEMLLDKGIDVNISSPPIPRPLLVAINTGNEDVVKLLLERGASVHLKSRNYYSSIQYAVAQTNPKIVEILLKHGADVNSRYFIDRYHGYTLLHRAVFDSNVSIAEVLLKNGACVNAQVINDSSTSANETAERFRPFNLCVKDTPLHIALKRRFEGMAKLLLEYKPNINVEDNFGNSILLLAVKMRNSDIINDILRCGPDLQNECNKAAFILALRDGEDGADKIVQNLLQYGFILNRQDAADFQLLDSAVYKGYVDIVRKLLDLGAKIDPPVVEKDPPYYRQSLLHRTADMQNEVMAKILVDYGADVNLKCNRGKTPLFYAVCNSNLNLTKLFLTNGAEVKDFELLCTSIKNGNHEIAKLLLQAGIDVNGRMMYGCDLDDFPPSSSDVLVRQALHKRNTAGCIRASIGKTALHIAAESNNEEMVKLLLEYGAKVDVIDIDSVTPLHISCERGNLNIVTTLLKHGSKVDFEDIVGASALYIAAEAGNEEMVRVLLENGAKADRTGEKNRTALLISAEKGHLKIVELLLKFGAKTDLLYNGKTALDIAAEHGHGSVVKILLENGANVNSRPPSYYSVPPLLSFAKSGHLATVEVLLKFGANVDLTDEFERTALHLAASGGHEEVVKILLQSQAKIHAKDKYGMTALHTSAEEGHRKTAESLLQNGANIECSDNFSRTALFIAAEEGQSDVAELLLERGANIDCKAKTNIGTLLVSFERDDLRTNKLYSKCSSEIWRIDESSRRLLFSAWGEGSNTDEMWEALTEIRDKVNQTPGKDVTPLFISATKGHEKVVELLLKFGANPKETDSVGKAVICLAAENGHTAVVKVLVEHGADAENVMKNGSTPLITFAKKGSVETVEALLKFGAKTESKDTEGQTAVYIAAKNGRDEVLKVLLKHGANADSRPANEDAALHMYATKGSLEMVDNLLKFGADINLMRTFRGTALQIAARYGHHDVVELLLKQGADVECHNGEMAPLLISAEMGHFKVVQILLKFKACIDAANRGKTALYLAAEKGHLEIVQLLLESGAKINLETDGLSPLIISATNGHSNIVEALLKAGWNPDSVNCKGRSALVAAAEKKHAGVVRILLKYGAQVDLKSKNGTTPLLDFIERGPLNIIDILLKFGACVDSTDADGKTALYIAAEEGNEEAARNLLEYGASVDHRAKKGMTPLLISIDRHHLNVMEVLLKSGAEIENQASFCEVAQHIVDLTYKQAETMKTLLEVGPAEKTFLSESNVRQMFDILNKSTLDYNKHNRKTDDWSESRRSGFRETAEVLVYYVAKMKAAKLFAETANFVSVSFNDEIKIGDFKQKCEAELAKANVTDIYGTSLSHYHILQNDLNQLYYINTIRPLTDPFSVHYLRLQFPIYAGIMKNQLEKGQIRKELIEQAIKKCHFSSQYFSLLTYDSIEKILQHLSTADLRNMKLVFKQISIEKNVESEVIVSKG